MRKKVSKRNSKRRSRRKVSKRNSKRRSRRKVSKRNSKRRSRRKVSKRNSKRRSQQKYNKKQSDVMNGGEGKIWRFLDLGTNAAQEIGINRLNSIGRKKRLYKMSEDQLLEKRIKWRNDGTGHTNGLEMLDNIWIDRFAENNTYYKEHMRPHLHCSVDEDTVRQGLKNIDRPLEAVRKELEKNKTENKIKIEQISILLDRLIKLKDKWIYNNGSIDNTVECYWKKKEIKLSRRPHSRHI